MQKFHLSGALLLASFAFILPTTASQAGQQDFDASKSANSFVEIGAGARAVAMGEAFTAVADDVSALHWNPAGLGIVPNVQVLFTHNQWIQDVTFENAMTVFPGLGGNLGLAATYVDYGVMDKLSESGQPLGGFSASDLGLTLGYGLPVSPYFSMGAAVKSLTNSLDGQKKSSWAYDAGALLIWPEANLQIGLSVLNLGLSADDHQPSQVKFGMALMHLGDWLTLAADANKHFDQDAFQVNGGAECRLGFLALRAGYQYSSADLGLGGGLSGVTFGGGLRQYFDHFGVNLDYAFVPYGDLGATHRFAVTLEMGGQTTSPAQPPESTETAQPAPEKVEAVSETPVYSQAAEEKADAPIHNLPTPPKKIRAKQVGTQVLLSWKAVPLPHVWYNVYQQSEGNLLIKLNSQPVKKTSFRTGKLHRKKTYYFVVNTVDNLGLESTTSNTVKVRLK
ncbi:MAG: PorV/PorQ family protein [Candidatus Firestonebacteria bacterium]|nr:PorV/PorQ family protein [Candidatus Firestonebacteria bacterium]